MIPKWTGSLVGKMHNYRIKNIDLANHLNVTDRYVSMVLTGIKRPANAEARFNKAVDEIIAERERR